MDEEKDNPGHRLAGRVGKLEVSMGSVQTDIKWIKMLVTPTFIISVISLLLLIASSIPR